MTNFERITESPEKAAEFFDKMLDEIIELDGDCYFCHRTGCKKDNCIECITEWLNRETEPEAKLEFHIDLNDNIALLEDGTMEDIWYKFGAEPREAYKDEDGCYYLDHDQYMGSFDDYIIERVHSKIIATANSLSEILELRDEYIKSRETEAEESGNGSQENS